MNPDWEAFDTMKALKRKYGKDMPWLSIKAMPGWYESETDSVLLSFGGQPGVWRIRVWNRPDARRAILQEAASLAGRPVFRV